MTYLQTLEQNKAQVQPWLDELLLKYKGQPIGWGYADIIIPRELVTDFIHELSRQGIAVWSVTWWCHCVPDNPKSIGCPHGGGGPQSKYYGGWFSECYWADDEIPQDILDRLNNTFTIADVEAINEKVLQIILNKKISTGANDNYLLFERDHCLTPAFWPHVPDDWRSPTDEQKASSPVAPFSPAGDAPCELGIS